MMKTINKYMNNSDNIRNGDEFVWDDLHFKVILFKNDYPVSFINLNDNDNNLDKAVIFAEKLRQGSGRKLV